MSLLIGLLEITLNISLKLTIICLYNVKTQITHTHTPCCMVKKLVFVFCRLSTLGNAHVPCPMINCYVAPSYVILCILMYNVFYASNFASYEHVGSGKRSV